MSGFSEWLLIRAAKNKLLSQQVTKQSTYVTGNYSRQYLFRVAKNKLPSQQVTKQWLFWAVAF
jgi:hypothetical protein